jgi:hypothetical protein
MKLILTIPQPEGWTKKDVERYVRTAVQMWAKGGDPDDPMWHAADFATVKPAPNPTHKSALPWLL